MLIICCIVECPLFKGQSAPTVFSCLAGVMSILIKVSPERRESIKLGQMWALQICATWQYCSSSLVLAHLKRCLGQHSSVCECIHSGERSGSMSVVNISILPLITFPSSFPSRYKSEESGINMWLLSNTWKVASQFRFLTPGCVTIPSNVAIDVTHCQTQSRLLKSAGVELEWSFLLCPIEGKMEHIYWIGSNTATTYGSVDKYTLNAHREAQPLLPS